MRTWVAVTVLLAGCAGGDGGIDQAGGAGGEMRDATSSNSDALQLHDTMSVNTGGVGGSTGDGAGGAQVGGTLGATGGTVATGGTGGTVTGGAGGTVVVDPLEPYPSVCEGFTQFRVPRQTCAVVRGRFTSWSGSKACDSAGVKPVMTCTIVTNLDQCPAKNGDPTGLCEGETFLAAVKAEPDRAFVITRYDLVANKCPKTCD